MDLIKQLISILAYFFSPRLRRRREKEKMYATLKDLEARYEKATQDGDPEACEKLHAQMDEAREKIEYLESKEV